MLFDGENNATARFSVFNDGFHITRIIIPYMFDC